MGSARYNQNCIFRSNSDGIEHMSVDVIVGAKAILTLNAIVLVQARNCPYF